jgi:hypothetical protein
MKLFFPTIFKTGVCISLSLLLVSRAVASEVCEDFKSAKLALEKYYADPTAVIESRSISTNAMFGFPNCHVQYTQNGLNVLEHVCEYDVAVPPKKQGERVIDAQDAYLTDLASELKSCSGLEETDESVAGMVASHFGSFLFKRFDDEFALGIDVFGGVGDDRYHAKTAITYLKKRRD